MIRALLSSCAKLSLAEATIFGIAKLVGVAPKKSAPSVVNREIDAVYLWVNDADPKWQAKRQQFRPTAESTVATAASRFRQFNELQTSIKLLSVNAPFVRKVFVVVDDQKPNLSGLGHDLPFEIVLVNHSEFIPEKYLPTFNSRAITAHLHLIPGLSENFLYLNDDVFIASPSEVDDWFDGNGIRVRFTETRFPGLDTLAANEVLYRARWKGVQLAKAKDWPVDDRMPQHAPYPLTRTILKKLWDVFPAAMEETATARFRTASAILPEQLAFYFAAGNGLATPAENSTYKYVPMNEASGIFPVVDLALKPNRFLTICLNDVSEVPSNNQISERALLKRYARVLRYLESAAGQ